MSQFPLSPEQLTSLTVPDVRMVDGLPTWYSCPFIPLGEFSLRNVVETAEQHIDSFELAARDCGLKYKLVGREAKIIAETTYDDGDRERYPAEVTSAIEAACAQLVPIVRPLMSKLVFSSGMLSFEDEGLEGEGSNVVPHLDTTGPGAIPQISLMSAYPRNTQGLQANTGLTGAFPDEILEESTDLLSHHRQGLADSWVSYEEGAFLMGDMTSLHKKPGYLRRKIGRNYRARMRLDFALRKR